MSTTTDNGGPAFPFPSDVASGEPGDPGMTLRDYFAAKAMHAALVTAHCADVEQTITLYAQIAYRVSDAMLEARK